MKAASLALRGKRGGRCLLAVGCVAGGALLARTRSRERLAREASSCVNSGTAPRRYRDVPVSRPVTGTDHRTALTGHLALPPPRNRPSCRDVARKGLPLRALVVGRVGVASGSLPRSGTLRPAAHADARPAVVPDSVTAQGRWRGWPVRRRVLHRDPP